jgi:hypothetical protein
MSEVGLRAQSRVLSPSYIYRYIDSLQQFDYKIAPREQFGLATNGVPPSVAIGSLVPGYGVSEGSNSVDLRIHLGS